MDKISEPKKHYSKYFLKCSVQFQYKNFDRSNPLKFDFIITKPSNTLCVVI